MQVSVTIFHTPAEPICTHRRAGRLSTDAWESENIPILRRKSSAGFRDDVNRKIRGVCDKILCRITTAVKILSLLSKSW